MKQADIIIGQTYKNSNGFPVKVESIEPARIKGMHARFIVRNLITGRVARRTAAGLYPMPLKLSGMMTRDQWFDSCDE